MSIRQDQAQLIITIDAKESVEYQKAVQRSNELVRNIKKMEVGTEEYNAAIREQVEISKRLAGADYSKLSLKNLQDRRKALQDQIRILPQAQAAELGLEQELRRVNQALSENAARTRATSQVLQQGSNDIRNFIGAYIGISAVLNYGQQIFEQIKQIDSLNKAYQLLIPVTNQRARADEFLTRMASNYGLEISKLRDEYIKYTASAKASTLSISDQELVFESVAKASSALGLSTETQSRAFTALQQIMSKGKVSAEELKGQLGDALPGAVTIMAKALGVGVGELQKMLENGEVMADEALPKFAIELQKAYGVDKITQIENVSAAQGRFKNKVTELITVIGGGFNTVLIAMFDILRVGLTYVIAFVQGIAQIPKFIKENEVAIKAIVLGLVLFNGQMILAAANSLRLAAVEKGRAIVTGAVTVAQNLLNAAMTANPIGLVIKAVGLLVVGFGILYAKSETVRAGIAGLGRVASEIFTIIKEAVGSFIDGFKQLKEGNFTDAFNSFGEAIKKSNPIGIAFTQGKRLKSAFLDGYNDKLAEAKAKKESEKLAKDLVDGLDNVNAAKNKLDDTNSDLSKTKGKKSAKDEEDSKKKSKKEDQFSEIPKTFTVSTTLQLEIDERFKQLEDAAKREQIILEESYQLGKITQDEYELEKLRNLSAHLATKLEMLSAAGLKESDKYREINVELLKTDKELHEARAQQISELDNANLTEVEQKFRDRLITEDEYNLSRLAVQKNFLDEQLRLLEENGLTETEVYKKIQEEKAKVQADYNAQKLANEERTQELIYQVQAQGLGAAADLFSLGAELLAGDEKARKKHASAIKAFESAKIAVNLAAEIQGIWKNANSNPINSLIPGWGPIYAAVQTGLAVGRAGIQLRNISSKQFKYGGRLKDGAVFDGPDHEHGGVKFGVGGEINEAEGGEIIINKRSSRVFAKELNEINTYNGYGKKLFSLGGVVSNSVPSLPSTTPALSSRVLGNNAAPQTIVQTDPRVEMLANSIEKLANIMPAALSNIRADVSYFDIKSKETTIEEIKYLARY